jgi:carboxyl-terminal processing protease
MKKLSLFVVIGIIVALFLVWGGVLLGLNPAVRSALDRFVSVAASDDASYQLQREVLDKLKTTYYKPVDERLLETRAIDGMVAGLGDPYTVYMDPEQYASFLEQASGLYSGVGMVVEMSSHFVTVVSTFKGRPAAEGGIMPGDIIIEVDGVSTEGLNLDEVVSKIKGEEGTEVAIEIYRPAPAATSTTAMLDGHHG